jgi:hypothetical protein
MRHEIAQSRGSGVRVCLYARGREVGREGGRENRGGPVEVVVCIVVPVLGG